MKKCLWTIIALLLPSLGYAAAGDTRIAEIYQCELKEGKTMEEVQANNTRWLANARKQAGSDEVRSYALETVVGNQETFMFIDSYPDMASWAAAEAAVQTEEGKAIEAAFGDLMKCTQNRLYKSTQH